MEYTSKNKMEEHSWANQIHQTRGIPLSERGFTYIEMMLSFALVMSFFPLIFGFFYQITSSVKMQLAEYQLWEQFDQFQIQMMYDAANGVKMVESDNHFIMIMKDGREVRYTVKNKQLIRSLKQSEKSQFKGNTILLYHIKKIHYEQLPKGWKMHVTLSDQGTIFKGIAYIWGRIDE
jgi:competence protein ComGF